MRIGILSNASIGGTMRVATSLARELARRAHQTHLFVRSMPPVPWSDSPCDLIFHPIVPRAQIGAHSTHLLTEWTAGESAAMLARLHAVIETAGLDVLHYHYALPFAFLAAQLKLRLGRAAPRIVGTLHGTDVSVYGKDAAIGKKLRHALDSADELTTVSVSHARLAMEVLELAVRPHVIPNFVDLPRFRPKNLEVANLGPDRPRLIHISTFRAVKDPASIAHIFVGIRRQIDVELWLVGEGPELDSIKAIVCRGGVEDDVRYWGVQREVAPLLAQTDLMLITSLSESFCLVALEAMACAVPVLATNVGGLPEVVVDGTTGYLFPVGDHAAAVQLAVNLLCDPPRHQAMRRAAADHARRFGSDRVVPLYEALYRRVMGA